MIPELKLLNFLKWYAIFSISAGLLAILAALLRRSKTALVLGGSCILAGLFFLFLLGLSELFVMWPSTLPVALAPVAFGGIALAIALFYRDRPPLKRFQVSVPAVLYVTLVVACFAGIAKLSERIYFQDRDRCLALLRHESAIDQIVILGDDSCRDYFWVQAVEFSLAGRPDTRVRLNIGRKYYGDNTIGYVPGDLAIQRIGKWIPGATETVHWHDSDGGQGSYPNDITGLYSRPIGPLRELVPLRLESIDDIAAHYDEIIAILEKWPRRDNPGKHTNADGTTIEYWVTEVDGAPVP